MTATRLRRFTKRRLLATTATALLAVGALPAAAQVTHTGKKVGALHGFYDSADCIYFKLEGVAQADPIKPGEPLFAISAAQPQAKNAYAALLASKVSGGTLLVRTRGNLVCGYAGVATIILE